MPDEAPISSGPSGRGISQPQVNYRNAGSPDIPGEGTGQVKASSEPAETPPPPEATNVSHAEPPGTTHTAPGAGIVRPTADVSPQGPPEEATPQEAKQQRPSPEQTGESLQQIPDAVDVGESGEDTEETWHRAGGGSPGPNQPQPPGQP